MRQYHGQYHAGSPRDENKDVDVIVDEEMALGKYRSSEEEILVAANVL